MTVLTAPRDFWAMVRNFSFVVSLSCDSFFYRFLFQFSFLFYMQSLMLTLCQNWICCKRSCYFPDTQPLPQNQTRDRENVLTQNLLGNQRIQVSILKNDAVNGKNSRLCQVKYSTEYFARVRSRIEVVLTPTESPCYVVRRENSIPKFLSPARNINSLNRYQ